jgi:drug/metabolite transporter (DMT)-like permease
VQLLGLVAALAAGVLFNVGSALQALDAREAPADDSMRLRLVARLARRRRWIAGLLLGGVGVGLQVVAFAHAPFVVVVPALSVGLVVLLAIGTRVLGERASRAELAGVAAIGCGIALLGVGAPAHNEELRSLTSGIAVLGVLALLALAPFALRGSRFDTAMVVIVASALGFGATNIATKLLTDEGTASHFAAAAAWGAVALALGVAATVSEMTALQRRRATTVIPISFGLQTFLPVMIEPLYLRERWETAALVGIPLAMGLALVLAGSVVLTRARSVSELAAG